MIFCFWLFVFSVHSVHSLRLNGYRNGFQNGYQNSYSNSLPLAESRWLKNNNLEFTTTSNLLKNSNKNSNDRILAEESNEDQLVERNDAQESLDSYSSPPIKRKKSHSYSFGYESNDANGNKQYRHEKKHEHTVSGSYGYLDSMSGIYRHVSYIADQNGFRAHIKTTEPGTASRNPASVEIESSPVQLAITKTNHYKNEYKQQASDVVAKQTEPSIEMRTIKKERQKSPLTKNSFSDYNSPKDYMHSPSDHVSNLNRPNKDDYESNFDRNYEDNYTNKDAPIQNDRMNDKSSKNDNFSTTNNAPIRHWNDAVTEPLNEQNDQIDEQQDDNNYLSHRRLLYRARLF